MKAAMLKDLYEYNYWTNKRLLSKAEMLTTDQLIMRTKFSWGNLRGTLVHIMDSERGWRDIFKRGVAEFDVMRTEQFPDLASIRTAWALDEAQMWVFLNSLTDQDLFSLVSYQADGLHHRRLLWHCLEHVVLHGMQHRSECAAMLTDFGQSPGDIDFTVFLDQH